MTPQEEMLSSISLSSDASTLHITGNTIGELVVSSSSFLGNAHLYFRRRNRWFCRNQQPAQQECQDNNDQQQVW